MSTARSIVAHAERVGFFELLKDLGQDALDGSINTAKGTRLQLKLDLRNNEFACVTLEYVSVYVRRVLDVECDFAGLG